MSRSAIVLIALVVCAVGVGAARQLQGTEGQSVLTSAVLELSFDKVQMPIVIRLRERVRTLEGLAHLPKPSLAGPLPPFLLAAKAQPSYPAPWDKPYKNSKPLIGILAQVGAGSAVWGKPCCWATGPAPGLSPAISGTI